MASASIFEPVSAVRVPVTQIGPVTFNMPLLVIKRLQSYFLGPIKTVVEMVQLVLSVPPFAAASCQSDSIKVGKGTRETTDLEPETLI